MKNLKLISTLKYSSTEMMKQIEPIFDEISKKIERKSEKSIAKFVQREFRD